MSLDVYLEIVQTTGVFGANITHNLNRMAEAAGIYTCLWCPEKIGIAKAHQLIEPLEAGLSKLRTDPALYRSFDPSNGWGSYDVFLPWVESYLEACKANPDADVRVSR